MYIYVYYVYIYIYRDVCMYVSIYICMYIYIYIYIYVYTPMYQCLFSLRTSRPFQLSGLKLMACKNYKLVHSSEDFIVKSFNEEAMTPSRPPPPPTPPPAPKHENTYSPYIVLFSLACVYTYV